MPSEGIYICFVKLYLKAIGKNSGSNPLLRVTTNAYEMLNIKKD